MQNYCYAYNMCSLIILFITHRHLGFNMISEIEDNAFQELKRLTTL